MQTPYLLIDLTSIPVGEVVDQELSWLLPELCVFHLGQLRQGMSENLTAIQPAIVILAILDKS